MSGTEIDTNSEETAQPATAETSSQESNTVSNNMANVITTLPSGLKLPRSGLKNRR
jgi:hypothetical protein